MPAGQTIESRKAEFRRYLEQHGVVDALTKVLVGLYEEPEKPANALEFVHQVPAHSIRIPPLKLSEAFSSAA